MQAPGARLIPIVFAMAFSVSAASQTVLASLLDDLSRYFGAAARLTINVIARHRDPALFAGVPPLPSACAG